MKDKFTLVSPSIITSLSLSARLEFDIDQLISAHSETLHFYSVDESSGGFLSGSEG